MKFKQWFKTPKAYVLLTLVALLIIASLGSQDMRGILHAGVAVVVCVALDIICSLIKRRKRIMPDGAIITGLIISLILSTTSTWFIVIATSILAILSKHILVYRKKPIFNPAATGLFLSIPLFQSQQSWWGAFGDLPDWTLAFVLIGGYIATNRVNKFPQVFSFLAMYFVSLYIMAFYFHVGDIADALRPPFINATLFFALFMLTDPPTSPAKTGDQIVFSLLAAAVSVVVYGYFGGLMYLFIGLFVGNLYQVWKSSLSGKTVKQVRPEIKKGHNMPF
ncbi:RnfABCDGE type electron transport complex subunit D [Thermicanus aegyptius]|uniref:RnfABCDGE type electron transport complex subunit D n=1 Tax=Thermicanus aegyptius TaxID=94009 RepID=UPI000404CC44|nr:RnfABCDGE type electron transport complex subunit D [Thermicanus aegyptius]